jgi:hypothetical protein
MFLRVYSFFLAASLCSAVYASDQRDGRDIFRVCGEESCHLNLSNSNVCIRAIGHDSANGFAFIARDNTLQAAILSGSTYTFFGQAILFDHRINGVQAIVNGDSSSIVFVASDEYIYAYNFVASDPFPYTLLSKVKAPECINALAMTVSGTTIVLYGAADEKIAYGVFSTITNTFVLPITANKKLIKHKSLCSLTVTNVGGIDYILAVKDETLYAYKADTFERIAKFVSDDKICGVSALGSTVYVGYDNVVQRLTFNGLAFAVVAEVGFPEGACVLSAVDGTQVIVGQCDVAVLASVV